MNYCCGEMNSAVQDGLKNQDVLMYDPVVRLYGYYIDRKIPIIRFIGYCPFCGGKLPDELTLEYFAVIEKELGLESVPEDYTSEYTKHLPYEFQSDEWWRKRGL